MASVGDSGGEDASVDAGSRSSSIVHPPAKAAERTGSGGAEETKGGGAEECKGSGGDEGGGDEAAALLRWTALSRQLALAKVEQRKVLLQTVRKLVGNVAKAPEDTRFHVVKLKNKIIAQRIVAINGGVDVMQAAGFVRSTANLEPCLRWKPGADERAAEAVRMVDWLAAAVYTGMGECRLQIKLPSGRMLKGGFARHDTLADVFAFVHGASGITKDLQLCRPFPKVEYSLHAHQSLTLAETGLAPSATLLVSLGKAAGASDVFRHAEADEELYTRVEEEPAEAIKRARAERRAKREAEKRERAAVLAEFQADRQEFKDRQLLRSRVVETLPNNNDEEEEEVDA